jgi:hypothetical protein
VILSCTTLWQVNEEKIKGNYAIFEEEVKRLDDKNQQFSNDVKEKHEFIKELIGDTKTGLQVGSGTANTTLSH